MRGNKCFIRVFATMAIVGVVMSINILNSYGGENEISSRSESVSDSTSNNKKA